MMSLFSQFFRVRFVAYWLLSKWPNFLDPELRWIEKVPKRNFDNFYQINYQSRQKLPINSFVYASPRNFHLSGHSVCRSRRNSKRWITLWFFYTSNQPLMILGQLKCLCLKDYFTKGIWVYKQGGKNPNGFMDTWVTIQISKYEVMNPY